MQFPMVFLFALLWNLPFAANSAFLFFRALPRIRTLPSLASAGHYYYVCYPLIHPISSLFPGSSLDNQGNPTLRISATGHVQNKISKTSRVPRMPIRGAGCVTCVARAKYIHTYLTDSIRYTRTTRVD